MINSKRLKIRATVLVRVLALVGFMAFGFTSKPGTSAKAVRTDGDSLLIAQRVYDAKISLLDVADADSIQSELIDSILYATGTRGVSGRLYYTPDSLYKIMVIEQEFCGGMYCNSGWHSYAYSTDLNKELGGGKEFYPVSEILRMNDGKYLVLQQHGQRPFSACGEDVYIATLFSVQHGSVINYPFNYQPTGLFNGPDKNGSLCFVNGIEEGLDSVPWYIRYDAKTKRLEYKYRDPCRYDFDSTGTYTGYFNYKKGAFIQGKETAVYKRSGER